LLCFICSERAAAGGNKPTMTVLLHAQGANMPPSSKPPAGDLVASEVGVGDTAMPLFGLALGVLVIAVLVLNAFAY
jgi:hypothetical protein